MNETIVVSILFGMLVVGCVIFAASQQSTLDDPQNTTLVYTEQLRNIAALSGSGTYILKTIRQSGNPHQKDRIFSTANEAVHAAMTTLRRAKVKSIRILVNSPVQLSLTRELYCGRGSNEGKKFKAIDIIKVG
jgi:hypothetical protein